MKSVKYIEKVHSHLIFEYYLKFSSHKELLEMKCYSVCGCVRTLKYCWEQSSVESYERLVIVIICCFINRGIQHIAHVIIHYVTASMMSKTQNRAKLYNARTGCHNSVRSILSIMKYKEGKENLIACWRWRLTGWLYAVKLHATWHLPPWSLLGEGVLLLLALWFTSPHPQFPSHFYRAHDTSSSSS